MNNFLEFPFLLLGHISAFESFGLLNWIFIAVLTVVAGGCFAMAEHESAACIV